MSIDGMSNMLNTNIRLIGLSSGLDTDTIIQQLMSIENMKVDRVKQDRQVLEWTRDAYRDVINALRVFNDQYFDILKPETNFLSGDAFSSFNIRCSDESAVTISAGAQAAEGTHNIKVISLATGAKIEGNTGIAAAVKGSGFLNNLDLGGKQINITLDGATKTIELEDYTSLTDLEEKLTGALGKAFGSGKIKVEAQDGKIEFKLLTNGSSLGIGNPANNFISSLNLSNGQKNFITGADIDTEHLDELNGKFKIIVGDGQAQVIEIDGAEDMGALRDKLQAAIDGNAQIAGKIHVAYDDDKLSFTDLSGEGMRLVASDTDNVLDKLGFSNNINTKPTTTGVIDMTKMQKGRSFIVNINGLDKIVELDKDYDDLAELAGFIEEQLGDNMRVNSDGTRLVFSADGMDQIIFKKGPEDGMERLGFEKGDNSNSSISLGAGLEGIKSSFLSTLEIDDPDANVTFTINGQNIDVGKSYKNATLTDVMNAINNSDAKVKINYDSLRGRFVMESKTLGVSSAITFEDTKETGGLLRAMGLSEENYIGGTDAEFDLDGVEGIKRTENDFVIDGVSYRLKGVTTEAVSIDIEKDMGSVVDKIKGFVNGYNEMLDKINGLLSEERDRNYRPLTEIQKKEMGESEAEKWEEKAKTGLLRNDSLLQGIVNSMRTALYEKVEGSSLSLYQIGITTGSYLEKGKLKIDENKLEKALKDNHDEVIKLFSNKSQYSYKDSLDSLDKRAIRYKESGLAQRLSDILQDNIRVTRDLKGNKGRLLEKAGIGGDVTEFDNLLNKQIRGKNTLIDTLIEKMYKKQEHYYAKFTAMEKMLSQMQSQSAWLTQQMAGFF